MKPFEFVEPATADSVVAVLTAVDATSRVLAGGSDLLGELKEGTASYDRLVSLAGIESLRSIEVRPDGSLRIGAMTRIVDIEYAAVLTGPYQMLAEAARSVATPEIRNQGTLGGNLCQRPRCLHFRSGLVPCLKKGGTGCPAIETPYQNYLSIFGGPGCFATSPSDLAPALIALDAVVGIRGASGRRDQPLEAFYTGPESDPTRENILQRGEFLEDVIVPPASPNRRGVYSKARERTAGDFAVISAAVSFELDAGVIRNARIVLGAAAPTPLRQRAAEAALEGQPASEALAWRVADLALSNATPLEHNAFKVDQAKALIARSILRLAAVQNSSTAGR